ncbi:MAG: ubiquitin-like domain-containing protein, partial [Candidatus Fonsibacter sp.]
MKLTVLSRDGGFNIYTVDVPNLDNGEPTTVLDLKATIMAATGIALDKQQLKLKRMILLDNDPLSLYIKTGRHIYSETISTPPPSHTPQPRASSMQPQPPASSMQPQPP